MILRRWEKTSYGITELGKEVGRGNRLTYTRLELSDKISPVFEQIRKLLSLRSRKRCVLPPSKEIIGAYI